MSETRKGAAAPRRRPGGRSARVHDAVVDAALAQLLAAGYPGLTIRGVAQAAGVAETTVYRRWPSADHLAAAALLRLAEVENPLPDTGTLEADLRLLLRHIVDLLTRPEVLRIVRSAAALDGGAEESIVAAKRAFFDTRVDEATCLVERAVERREVAPGVDGRHVIEALVAPAYLRVLLYERPLDEALVESSVRAALAVAGQTVVGASASLTSLTSGGSGTASARNQRNARLPRG